MNGKRTMRHHLWYILFLFLLGGRKTTLTVETEVYREDGTYLCLYLFGEPDVVEALDERIMAYYEELGI